MAATSRDPLRHIEALELFADVLAQLEDEATPDAFYSQLCEAICRLTSMERAVIFHYDGARRRVRAIGAHGLNLTLFAGAHVSVESAPVARRALAEDRVIEVVANLDEEVSPAYAELLRGRHLVVTPMVASGRWVGVVLADRPPTAPSLGEEERELLWTLGKSAALATMARTATSQSERARQLQQRIDMAREIHDGVIQRLFGVSLALGEAPLAPEDQQRCAQEIQLALADLRDALQRPLSRASRPTGSSLLEEVHRLASEHPDLGVVLVGDDDVALSAELEPLAQSVLAEAVRNAHKHAEPTELRVCMTQADGTFVLEITNDGVHGKPPTRTGMGLRLAAFEALQFGGVLEFGERDKGVWQVKLVVPHDGD